MPQDKQTYRFGRASARRRNKGFTLLEMAVTLTVILLAATLVVPSVGKMLASSADTEAFNLLAAQLTAARAEAISQSTYAGIHVQLHGTPRTSETKGAYTMVIIYDRDKALFKRPEHFLPHRLPGMMAAGELSSDPNASISFISNQDPGTYRNLGDNNLPDFCSFSVIFSPDGTVVSQVRNEDDTPSNIRFMRRMGDNAGADPAFWAMFVKLDTEDNDRDGNTNEHDPNDTTGFWRFEDTDNESGVSAFTLFDYGELQSLDSGQRANYLDESGQFMPVNMHTGQLFDRM